MNSTPVTPILSTGQDTASTRITHPRTLTFIKAAWIGLVVYTLVIAFVALQPRFTYLSTPGTDSESQMGLGKLTDSGVQALESISLSATFFASLFTSLEVISAPVFVLMSALILWRGQWTFAQVLMAFLLIPLGVTGTPLLQTLWLMQPAYEFPVLTLEVYGTIAFGLLVMLFPDGHFQPRLIRWFMLLVVVYVLSWLVLPNLRPTMTLITRTPQQDLWYLWLTIGLILVVVTQVYRYRRVSTPVQRQQTRWFMLAVITYALAFLVFGLPLAFLPELSQATPVAIIYGMVIIAVILVGRLFLGLSIALAVLRYRLWEVDLFINRSLVYGAITLMGLAIFFVAVLGIQIVAGNTQPLIAAVIALVVMGVLFNPTRRQVQHFVDRRIFHFNFDLNQLAAAQKLPDIQNPGALSGRRLDVYDVLDVIGKGGMGEVYKGRVDGQTVALKILPDDLAQQDEFRKRFEREARTLTALDHPNIVRMISSGNSDGIAYLAMEYIEGEELGKKLKTDGALSLDDAHHLLGGLAAALDYAHERGFIHRDLKPSNVMLRRSRDGETWEAVLMDFGVAKIREAQTGLTQTGAIGTIDYMASEQIQTAKEVDRRADVYALGIVAYEMLTGERPFKGGAAQVMFAHLQQPVPDPRDVKNELPSSVAKAVMKAMAKQPDECFPTAGEFIAALA